MKRFLFTIIALTISYFFVIGLSTSVSFNNIDNDLNYAQLQQNLRGEKNNQINNKDQKNFRNPSKKGLKQKGNSKMQNNKPCPGMKNMKNNNQMRKDKQQMQQKKGYNKQQMNNNMPKNKYNQ
ncbi:MAG: hypothetical protein SVN78_02380 [Deferribacterota bacterium]|nr:hypothetical protein [Deferribacterota bacterium]